MPKIAAPTQYNTVAKFFHWSIALLILGMLGLGWYMSSLEFTPQKFQLIQLHKSVGILVLIMVVLRILWRFTYRAPKLPSHMPFWQKGVAHLSHYGLYYLMFSMPMTGYVMSDAAGYHPSFFGLPVPILSEPNPETAKFLNFLHVNFAFALAALIAAHVGAALYHHFIVKDDVLKRMAPCGRKLLSVLALLAIATTANAADWTINPATSKLSWKATFNGQPVSGAFGKWNGTIALDPADLTKSNINISIDMASVNSNDANRDTTLKGPDFFNTPSFATATFTSTNVTKTTQGYVAAGNLTLAGVTKPLAVPFTLTVTGKKAVASGKFSLSRTAFSVGKGQWAKASEIADLVEVTFNVDADAK